MPTLYTCGHKYTYKFRDTCRCSLSKTQTQTFELKTSGCHGSPGFTYVHMHPCYLPPKKQALRGVSNYTHWPIHTKGHTNRNIFPLNMPSVVITVYAATESSRVCQEIAIFYSFWEFHIHLCNVCAACLGLEQLSDRMDENHSPEGPCDLSHPREPGGGAGSEWRGVVCSLESEPAHHLCSVTSRRS